MKKILTLIILLLLVFLLYNINNKKTTDRDSDEEISNIDEKALDRAKKITRINANQLMNPGQVEPVVSARIRRRIPDLTKVLSNIDLWKNDLVEEDFKIIRELQAKVESKQIFNDYDNILVTRLEDKNIINAILQNNPALILKDAPNEEPAQNDQVMPEYQPEPDYIEPQQPVDEPLPVEDVPVEQPEYIENNN